MRLLLIINHCKMFVSLVINLLARRCYPNAYFQVNSSYEGSFFSFATVRRLISGLASGWQLMKWTPWCMLLLLLLLLFE